MCRKVLLVMLLLAVTTPSVLYAQKFSKKEQARREAREANYFCGATFTLTAGYEHSWMNEQSVSLSTKYYGRSEKWANTHDSFNVGFLWDQALSKKWGVQAGLFYKQKGGDHLFYYDNGLGYGAILRPEETVEAGINMIELQSQMRRFFALSPKSRVSVGAGIFIDKFIDAPDDVRNWNLGVQASLGYDWRHLALSVTYQCGLLPSVVCDCNSRMSSVSINAGFRFWKK